MALEDGEVGFLDLAALDGHLVESGGFGVFGEEDEAGGFSV